MKRVSQTKKGRNYNAVLPDKITIFQKPIERDAQDEEDLKEIVKEHRLARNCSSFWNERNSSAPSRNKEDKKKDHGII